VLAENRKARIGRIVSRGHSSPPGFWYDQDRSEFVLLLEGEAAILFAGDDVPIRLEAGDYLTIPPRRRHRVEWTVPGRDTIWLAVYF
jgi:cupin 2 domain-containing protein